MNDDPTKGVPAHLAGTAYIISQRPDGCFSLKLWNATQWQEFTCESFALALAKAEGCSEAGA